MCVCIKWIECSYGPSFSQDTADLNYRKNIMIRFALLTVYPCAFKPESWFTFPGYIDEKQSRPNIDIFNG